MPCKKVKKLISLSPDKYKLIPMELAIKQYGYYCFVCGALTTQNKAFVPKNFTQWLATEI